MINEAAKVAAQWWADQLRRPPKMDNGDREFAVIATLMQASFTHVIPGEKILAFQAALERKIIEEWEAGDPLDDVTVQVDYDPKGILEDAAIEADVSLSSGVWPVKTITWVEPDKVILRHGYGAPMETIYKSDRP